VFAADYFLGMVMGTLSTFLFARPSFAEGAARIVDFGDTLREYNTSLTSEQADYLALFADWRQVGMDIQRATLEYSRQVKEGCNSAKTAEQR
jgi:hypothetical protein